MVVSAAKVTLVPSAKIDPLMVVAEVALFVTETPDNKFALIIPVKVGSISIIPLVLDKKNMFCACALFCKTIDALAPNTICAPLLITIKNCAFGSPPALKVNCASIVRLADGLGVYRIPGLKVAIPPLYVAVVVIPLITTTKLPNSVVAFKVLSFRVAVPLKTHVIPTPAGVP
jgi:hypothetical protein